MTRRPKLPIQTKEKRIKNFQEVSVGFSKKMALDEAKRCPQCSVPSCLTCPLGVDIPAFIRLMRENDMHAALEKIREQNALPAVCGRVCLAPCEGSCIFEIEEASIAIRTLERYAADHGRQKFRVKRAQEHSGPKVAVVGSGPSGLTAAWELAKKNYQVTIYEMMPSPGGILHYGIPEARLPKSVLKAEIDEIKMLGVEIVTSCHIGQTVSLDELFEEENVAVLLAMGTGGASLLNIPGAYLGGVYYGEELLIQANYKSFKLFKKQLGPKLGKKIVVLGSGNIALDCARLCVRLGKDVSVISMGRKEEAYIPFKEQEYGQEEGIHFEGYAKPLEIVSGADEFVSGVKCIRMDFADPDDSGQWRLLNVPDSEFAVQADTVVIAAGHKANPFISKISSELKTDKDGRLWIDEKTHMTSVEGVFAAGDVTAGCRHVVTAMASGKKAAEHMDVFLRKQ